MTGWPADRRRRVTARFLSLLGALVIFGPYVAGRPAAWAPSVHFFAEATADPLQPIGQLTIVTYNIAHGRGTGDWNWGGGSARDKRERIERIGRDLRQWNADIVVLNEVDFDSSWSGRMNQAAELARLGGFPYYVEQRNFELQIFLLHWRFGNAVLSRYPLEQVEAVELPCYARWEQMLAGSKQGLRMTIRLTGDRRCRLFAVHWEPRDEATRVASAERLIDEIQSSPDPCILAGDFNTAPQGAPGYRLTLQGTNAVDRLLASGFLRTPDDHREQPSELSFSTLDPRVTIDWILIPQNWEYLRYETLDAIHSDHRPVRATVAPSAAW
jgi:endonuclease/exonuclease/phosphatase family metal-dependent hydrolase